MILGLGLDRCKADDRSRFENTPCGRLCLLLRQSLDARHAVPFIASDDPFIATLIGLWLLDL